MGVSGTEVSRSSATAETVEGAVIIFDWDDTLFPTWFVSEVVLPCMPEEHRGERGQQSLEPLPSDSAFTETLTQHAVYVRQLLYTAREIGRVGIVTLSQRPWVLSCALRYLPGIDFEQILRELQIPVIYARECVKRSMLATADVEEGVNILTLAKQAAMKKALKKLYGKDGVWHNIISIGDSVVERDAIKELLWSQEEESVKPLLCKTVKLMEEPSVEQLGAEMMLLSMWLRAMASHNEDFDIVMDDSQETRCQMHDYFKP